MAFGPFRFGLSSFGYDEIKRKAQVRSESVDIINARPSIHKSGLEVETISMRSFFHPLHLPGNTGLRQVAAMRASVGSSYGFVGNRVGIGDILGVWMLDSVEDTQTEIFVDGLGQAVEVGMEFKYDGRSRSSGAEAALASLIG
jgi:hypothetical protein